MMKPIVLAVALLGLVEEIPAATVDRDRYMPRSQPYPLSRQTAPSTSAVRQVTSKPELSTYFGAAYVDGDDLSIESAVYEFTYAPNEKWELALAGDAYTWIDVDGAPQISGVGDAAFKLTRFLDVPWLAGASVQTGITAPIGSNDITSHHPDLYVRGKAKIDAGKGRVGLDLRLTRIARVRGSDQEPFTAKAIVSWERALKTGFLYAELAQTVRDGAGPTAAASLVYSRPIGARTLYLVGSKGVSRGSRDAVLELALEFPVGL